MWHQCTPWGRCKVALSFILWCYRRRPHLMQATVSAIQSNFFRMVGWHRTSTSWFFFSHRTLPKTSIPRLTWPLWISSSPPPGVQWNTDRQFGRQTNVLAQSKTSSVLKEHLLNYYDSGCGKALNISVLNESQKSQRNEHVTNCPLLTESWSTATGIETVVKIETVKHTHPPCLQCDQC